jgi:F-type H+-transporting ATPase subunit delta
VRAQVTTAVPLPADRITALRQGLEELTGRQVRLDVQVDPEIVGGAVARIGSTVYDGSITTQLEKMKQRLVAAGT